MGFLSSVIVPLARTKLGQAVTGIESSRDVPAGEAWYEYVEIDSVINSKIIFRVKKYLYFSCKMRGKTYRVCVPPGFRTDLASTPAWIWSLYPPFGNYTKAAIIHDFMTGCRAYPFSVCDSIFLEAMKQMPPRTSWRTRNIFYLAVRLFGRAVYAKHTVETISKDRESAFSCSENRWECPFAAHGCDKPGDEI